MPRQCSTSARSTAKVGKSPDRFSPPEPRGQARHSRAWPFFRVRRQGIYPSSPAMYFNWILVSGNFFWSVVTPASLTLVRVTFRSFNDLSPAR